MNSEEDFFIKQMRGVKPLKKNNRVIKENSVPKKKTLQKSQTTKTKKEIKKFYKEDKNKNKLKEDLINYNLFNSLENYFINKVKEVSTDKIREKKDNKWIVK